MDDIASNTIVRRTTPRYADVVRDQPAFLALDGIVKHYPVQGFGSTKVVKSVDGVTVRIAAGEVLGLVGESGCGKSSLAKVISRLTSATDGQITINGQDWLKPSGEELRRQRRNVQLIFQDPFSALDPRMTIGESMLSPLAQNRIGNHAERLDKVYDMLEEAGLDASFFDRRPSQCSGGQLQRVVIGRALLLEPKLLVCDEPTSALDASMRTQILNLLMELKQKRGLTMLMISHDLRVVRYLCDRIAVMYLGQIVEMAPSNVLFAEPRHPYTKALIASSLLDQTGLHAADGMIEGELPSPLDPPHGCRFHSRCRHARPDCAILGPALKLALGEHFVRCRYSEQIAS
ncbi:ABC transporter ATP-binding protein [Pelagibacterium sp.]|uniref:ABC transporter ATP-binding protein n=1 Tax=Pelagibacterium sp. TaxID=1967288 RepID=UPI003BAD1490